MGYVVAGYVIVLSTLFLYGLSLMWRRRRLNQAVARVVQAPVAQPAPAVGAAPTAAPAPGRSGADR
jgi:hypothetical protein